jgi:hypothetical protein
LVYAAWAATCQKENTTHVGIPKDNDLRYKSSVKVARSCSLQMEQLDAGKPEQSDAAA